jgi:subtilisin family serine protease
VAHVNDELILVGQPAAVGEAVAHAGGAAAAEQRTFTVSHQGRTLQFLLAKTGIAAAQALGQIADWARSAKAPVMAEANGAVANPRLRRKQSGAWSLDPWTWIDDPWTWIDDPWTWIDDPWTWIDDPATLPPAVPAGNTPAEGAAAFWQQGAFQRLGLTDAAGVRNPALAGQTGAGVLVGLFDAIPAGTVSQPWLTIHPGIGPVHGAASGADLSDHGLFCASLVHAVAPAAAVHLYQVCGADGQGRLFPLLEAISAFIDLATGKPAVISLSLGSPDATGSAALRALLQKATDLGIVVCAAAGNLARRAPKVSALPAAQVPAAFPNVIAVAAANASEQRASYSQRGDIAAPGGEALGQPGPDDEDDIIGMGVSAGTSGYVRMDAGTSFATPLVAGAAALLMVGQPLDPGTQDRILAALKAGARPASTAGEATLSGAGLGAGILYLPNLFNR